MMHTLKAGTTLYHGTDNDDFDEDSSSLHAFSWVTTSKTVAERFSNRSGGWGGIKRVVEYRLSEDLALHEITSSRQMQAFAEEHNLDLCGVEEMRDSAQAAGIPGWIIPSNYLDGDDILIAETHLLDYVGTTKKEWPAAPPVGEIERAADNLEASSGLLHGSAFTPARTAYKLLRSLVKELTNPRELEIDGFKQLTKDLRHYSSTVANPASQRMQDAAVMLERLNDAGICR